MAAGSRTTVRGPRLGVWLLASGVVHLAVVALLAAGTGLSADPMSASALRISVQAPSTAGSVAGAGGAETAAEPAPADGETARTADKAQQGPAQRAEAAADGAHAPPGDDRIDRAEVIAELAAQLRNHFTYPALARQRGWQGEVVLRLDIHANGRLDNVAIASSSGHRVLDRSALDALRALAESGPLGDYQHRIEGLYVPVIFRLEG